MTPERRVQRARRYRSSSVLAAWAAASALGALSVGCGLLLGVDYDEAAIDRAAGPGRDDATTSGGACAPRACGTNECGLLDDGCGGTITCSACAPGSECVAGRCRCNGDTCRDRGVVCGPFDNGCPLSPQCGTCTVAQYGCTSEGSCRCLPRACPDGGADAIPCGTAPSGCGERYVCGVGADECPFDGDPEDGGVRMTCGGGGQNFCGTAACARVECQPGECGQKSNGCDDVLDCGGCDAGICGANGIANQCGCEKDTCPRLGIQCGTVSDGCGGMMSCGECEAPELCSPAGTCECQKNDPVQACAGKTCGYASDGCRSFHVCGPPCPADAGNP